MIELFNLKVKRGTAYVVFDDDVAEHLTENGSLSMGDTLGTTDEYYEMILLIDDYIRTECE